MKVLIVGAGAAGLYAAYLLKAQGIQIQILEARGTVGGRIQSHQGFASHPIDLGAAYIHGRNNALFELAQYHQATIGTSPRTDWYFWEGKMLTHEEALQNEVLQDAINLFPSFYPYKGPELSLAEYAKGRPAGEASIILDGICAEYGTDLSGMGIQALAQEERLWGAEGGDYHVEQGMPFLFQEIIADVQEDIRLNCPVAAVHIENGAHYVITAQGERIEAEKIVITVPLSVLKSGLISFSPPLPPQKQEAILRLGIGAGSKVFLKFKEKFWPDNFSELYGGSLCSLYETIPFSAEPILVAYCMGKSAERIMAKTDEEAAQALAQELDALFGEGKATRSLQAWHCIHWAKEPYIWGAYSFAAPYSLGMRKELFKPIGRAIFFAGEAAHFEGYNSTVHGAMETASWVADEIMLDFEQAMQKQP